MKKKKQTFYKLFGLFSLVRGYNIILVCIAQYLAAISIFSQNKSIKSIIFDHNLFMLVLASALCIASGYIINNFYDFEKDIINKPLASMITHLISQNTKLTGYFILNFLAVIVAGYISFRAILFFSSFIFGLWIYSHRLKRIPFIGNIVSTTLAVTPFFAIFLYYKNTDTVIFVHALFLYLLLLIKTLIKDLTTIPGDLTHNYQTIPVKYGEKKAKIIISITTLITLGVIYTLIQYFSVGNMIYYFIVVGITLIFLTSLLWKKQTSQQYNHILLILKIFLILGVFNLFFIRY